MTEASVSETPITDLVRRMRKASPTEIVEAILNLPRRGPPQISRKSKGRKRLLPWNWDQIRLQVFERDGYVCVYCSTKTENPHCDHKIPLSRGGSNDLENLATACSPCNSEKGARTPEEWVR